MHHEAVLGLWRVLEARASPLPALLVLQVGGCLAAQTSFCHFSHHLAANLTVTSFG